MAANNHIGSLSKQYNLSLLYPVPLDGWNKSDTLVYTLPNSIPAGNYEAEIGIRYQESYPYRDIWLGVSHNTEDTLTYVTDTLQLF